jgi:hypothetical protein
MNQDVTAKSSDRQAAMPIEPPKRKGPFSGPLTTTTQIALRVLAETLKL